jgi:predicted aminopeptidase
MPADDLTKRILSEGIVTLDAAAWQKVAGSFEELERHDTFIAGHLVIARRDEVLVAVEEPMRDRRVIRRLADDGEARRFVKDRLDTYERMWDGCGCKVEYYR